MPYATLSIFFILLFLFSLFNVLFYFPTCPYLYICNSCILCMYVCVYIYIYIYIRAVNRLKNLIAINRMIVMS